MFIGYNESAEIIPRMNSYLDDRDVVSIVGLEVVVKNNDKLTSYISDIVHVSKASVDDEHLDVIGKNYITRYHMNRIMKKFEERVNNNKLIEVIENDGYTKKLINVNTIVEVRSFAANPEDDGCKKQGLRAIASLICG